MRLYKLLENCVLNLKWMFIKKLWGSIIAKQSFKFKNHSSTVLPINYLFCCQPISYHIYYEVIKVFSRLPSFPWKALEAHARLFHVSYIYIFTTSMKVDHQLEYILVEKRKKKEMDLVDVIDIALFSKCILLNHCWIVSKIYPI